MIREDINTLGINISVIGDDKANEFISLTDIAKYKDLDNTTDLIKNWMRNRNTIEFIGLWESIHNTNFNDEAYQNLLADTGKNTFLMSPRKWISETNAKGIYSKSGRGGGTFAHPDIAFEFASWISPEFKLYLIKDYQNLKQSQSSHFNLEWSVSRQLSKVNYGLHTDSIKNNLIPNSIDRKQIGFIYANEADRLNKIILGMTAREWKETYPDKNKNIRENLTIDELILFANLENLNSTYIREHLSEKERTEKLIKEAQNQVDLFIKNGKQLPNLNVNLKEIKLK